MKKQKKQSLLTMVITILVIALVMLVGSIVYEEAINMGKQQSQNTSSNIDEDEDKDVIIEDNETTVEDEVKDEVEDEVTTGNDAEFVGEEENNNQEENTQSKDAKVIDLVKKEWGNDDSVTFNIEKKNGSKYRVAVRDSSTTVLQWYEVDTETWEVSEY